MENNTTSESAETSFPAAEEIINALGGIRPAAAKLAVPVTTVQGWKNRGRIPENRQAEIERALADQGINIASLVSDDNGNEFDKDQAASEGKTHVNAGRVQTEDGRVSSDNTEIDVPVVQPVETNSGNRGLLPASVALLFSALALLAVAVLIFRPELLAGIQGNSAKGSAGRVVEVEALLAQKFAGVTKQFEQLIAAQEELGKQQMENEQRVAALAEKISAMPTSVNISAFEDLERKSDSVQGQLAKLRAEIQQTSTGLSEEISSIEKGLQISLNAIGEKSDAISLRQAEIDKRLSASSSDGIKSDGGRFALSLAVGQLEMATRSDVEFRKALERVRNVAQSFPKVIPIIDQLAIEAEAGLVSRQVLMEGFAGIRSKLAAGRPPSGGWGVADGAWAQIKAAIGLRRIGPKSASPITLIERAIQDEDWNAALKASEGYGPEVNEWRQRVERRRALELNLFNLHSATVNVSSLDNEKMIPPSEQKDAK